MASARKNNRKNVLWDCRGKAEGLIYLITGECFILISVTKLLFAREYYGDQLRYTKNAHAMRNGAAAGLGPVVVWNSTKTCNLKCMHCYMQSDAQKYKDELTTEEAKKFIDDLADFHVPVLLFSGGEPLIRPDFFELAEYAEKKGVRPTLSTNGTLITREVAQRIKDIGVGYVGISLDGLKDVNDKFRGVEGAYEKAMQGIENCVAVGQRAALYHQPPQYHGTGQDL